MRSQVYLVRIEARLQPRWHAVRIPVGSRHFLFSKNIQTRPRARPAYHSMGTRVPSLGVKWPGYYVMHSPPFNAEVKNEWCYTATPPVCLHEQCHNFHKIQQEKAKQSGSDLFSQAHYVYVYHTIWRATAQCPAQVCWLLWCLSRGPPCSSSEALCVFVTSALEHSLYMYNDSACIHIPLVTVAQFQLLHNISPPPWSQCHFLTHNYCCPQSVRISDLVFTISLSL